MIIDARKGYGTGHGDLVLASWIPDLEFHAVLGKRELLQLLGQTINKTQPGIPLRDCWAADLKHCKEKPRLQIWAETLGKRYEDCRRPTITIPDKSKEWAEKHIPENACLLFPQVEYVARSWHPANWVDLCFKLEGQGIRTVVMMKDEDKRFTSCRYWMYGQSWGNILAAMERSRLIIGNDSCPAHLGGTLGKPTIAIMGPTHPNVFAHLPVITVQGEMECSGCHFAQPQFRKACTQGCMSLLQLPTETVIKKALPFLV